MFYFLFITALAYERKEKKNSSCQNNVLERGTERDNDCDDDILDDIGDDDGGVHLDVRIKQL